MEEPTDEMLAQIMHEAAEIYNRENQEAHDKLFANMQKNGKGTTTKIQLELMDTKQHKPVLIVIAGPNGSGKTTITSRVLQHEWLEDSLYINPDNVAQHMFGD